MNQLTIPQKQAIYASYALAPMPIIYMNDDESWEKKPSPFSWAVVAGTHYGVNNTRLSLRPLSAITDEDAIEVARFVFAESSVSAREGHRLIGQIIDPEGIPHWTTDFELIESFFMFEFLRQGGYAVPLFIAPNHPDNGKTAIQMGIAIDSSKI